MEKARCNEKRRSKGKLYQENRFELLPTPNSVSTGGAPKREPTVPPPASPPPPPKRNCTQIVDAGKPSENRRSGGPHANAGKATTERHKKHEARGKRVESRREEATATFPQEKRTPVGPRAPRTANTEPSPRYAKKRTPIPRDGWRGNMHPEKPHPIKTKRDTRRCGNNREKLS